jgi:cell division protein FtsZ
MMNIKREQIVATLSKGLVEPKISVVGCGGAGNNVVNSIYWSNKKVETVAVNTDETKLDNIVAHKKVLIGKDVTHGEGAKGFPEVGEHCADMARSHLASVLKGSDIVIVIAGMGGGTGTGAAPVVAEVAKGLNAVTFAIAINPFSHERGRQDTAKEGIKKLRNVAEHTIVLENDRLLQLAGDVSITESFAIMERSINGMIDSMTHQISEDVVAPIREEVDAYMREKASVEIVNNANALPVTELISAIEAHKTVEMSFTSSADSHQLLSR